MNIEKGMFIRIDGEIAKVHYIERRIGAIEITTISDGKINSESYVEEYDFKASHNIIDLIEEGDLVFDSYNEDWIKIYDITEAEYNCDTRERCFNGGWNDMGRISKEQIKLILTHEQLEQHSFRLEN